MSSAANGLKHRNNLPNNHTMKGKTILYVDQYGRNIFAKTVSELREKAGGGRVSKMYCGETHVFHIGYVVGGSWFRAFEPVRIPDCADGYGRGNFGEFDLQFCFHGVWG